MPLCMEDGMVRQRDQTSRPIKTPTAPEEIALRAFVLGVGSGITFLPPAHGDTLIPELSVQMRNER